MSSKNKPEKLPQFIPPMLAQPRAAFDSPEYFFEIKWDGTRTLAFIEAGRYRLVNRRRIDMTDRYPEFEFLQSLPVGTVLDGEMIVLKDGKPDFNLLQSREQARTPLRIRNLARMTPATYVVFDVLYENHESIMDRRLSERREHLARLVRRVADPHLVLSEGVVGEGKKFFAEACGHNLEGVIAKRLASRYLPGQRTEAWFKIKKTSELICAILGFLPEGNDDFRSLILAAQDGDKLHCAGKVGTGFPGPLRKKLNQLLWSRLRPKPAVPCKIKGKWVAPGLFCRVTFMERTANGELRAPAFKELIVRE
jgi:bifunctional non-homologous end joining protein LigD